MFVTGFAAWLCGIMFARNISLREFIMVRGFGPILACALSFGLAGAAHAQMPWLSSSGSVGTLAGPPGNEGINVPYSFVGNTTPLSFSESATYSGYILQADAATQSIASYGILRSSSSAFVEAFYIGGGTMPLGGGVAVTAPGSDTVVVTSGAESTGGFQDTIIYNGAGPVGTPVQVAIPIALYASLTTSASVANETNTHVLLTVDANGVMCTIGALALSKSTDTCPTGELLTTAYIGEPFTLAAQVATYADAYPDLVSGDLAQGEGNADAFDTAVIGLDVLTTGVTYTSASGTIYATTSADPDQTSVPEPSSIALVGFSFVGLGLVRHRRSTLSG
jgi:hypothetical protein